VNDGRQSGMLKQPTSLVDIAPTIASFLGMSLDGFDGSPLEGKGLQ
jgi:arylsulfatase A-like enzyme